MTTFVEQFPPESNIDPRNSAASTGNNKLQPEDPGGGSVQKLIEGNLDNADGLELAAEAASDESIESLCRDAANVRRRHAVELQRRLAEQGHDPGRTGSWLAGLQLWWSDLTRRFRRRPMPALLRSCERSERRLGDEYDHALAATRLMPLRSAILRQQAHVMETRQGLRDVRELLESRDR